MVFGPKHGEATMFSENRSLASKVFRALFVTCVSTALGSLAPAFGQSLPSADLPGLIDALIDPPPATGAFAYNSFVPSLTPGARDRKSVV